MSPTRRSRQPTARNEARGGGMSDERHCRNQLRPPLPDNRHRKEQSQAQAQQHHRGDEGTTISGLEDKDHQAGEREEQPSPQLTDCQEPRQRDLGAASPNQGPRHFLRDPEDAFADHQTHPVPAGGASEIPQSPRSNTAPTQFPISPHSPPRTRRPGSACSALLVVGGNNGVNHWPKDSLRTTL